MRANIKVAMTFDDDRTIARRLGFAFFSGLGPPDVTSVQSVHAALGSGKMLCSGQRAECRELIFCWGCGAGLMVPDAEVLSVASEILSSLPIGDFQIKLNHRRYGCVL